jgi:hypothetical protein
MFKHQLAYPNQTNKKLQDFRKKQKNEYLLQQFLTISRSFKIHLQQRAKSNTK